MRVCGPRYCGPGWSNEGAGFRRRTSVCPPPHLHKCRATLQSTAERCGKTAVPSWNSRSGRSETRNADRALTGRTRWSGRQGLPSASLGQGSAGYVEGVRRRWCGGSGCGVVCSVTRAWEPGPDAGLRAALLRARVVEPGCGLQATCARLPPPLIYINVGQHCGDLRNGAGKQWCHLGNSRVADRDGHRGLHSKVYSIVIFAPTQRRIGWFSVMLSGRLCPVCFRYWTRNLPNMLGSRGGIGRVGVRDRWGLGLKSTASAPLGLRRRYRCRKPSPYARPELHQRD